MCVCVLSVFLAFGRFRALSFGLKSIDIKLHTVLLYCRIGLKFASKLINSNNNNNMALQQNEFN